MPSNDEPPFGSLRYIQVLLAIRFCEGPAGLTMKNRISPPRFVLVFAWLAATSVQAADYLPPPGDGWEVHTPQQEGLDPTRLKAAVDFAIANETKFPPELSTAVDVRDLRVIIPLGIAGEPFSDPIGPLKPRAPANGRMGRHACCRHGEFGDENLSVCSCRHCLRHSADPRRE
jgi:hypothetical protein